MSSDSNDAQFPTKQTHTLTQNQSESRVGQPVNISVSHVHPVTSSSMAEGSSQCSGLSSTSTAFSSQSSPADKNIIGLIRLYIGISGPYNLQFLCSHIHRRGLDFSVLMYIFLNNLRKYSPTVMLADMVDESCRQNKCAHCLYMKNKAEEQQHHQNQLKMTSQGSNDSFVNAFDYQLQSMHTRVISSSTYCSTPKTRPAALQGNANSKSRRQKLSWTYAHCDCHCGCRHCVSSDILSRFPPVALLHGTEDMSIPSEVCSELAGVLRSGGAQVCTTLFDGWSHTDPILEGPLGGKNDLFLEMKRVIDAALLTSRQQDGSEEGDDDSYDDDKEKVEIEEVQDENSSLTSLDAAGSHLTSDVDDMASVKALLADPAVVAPWMVSFARFVNPF